MHGITIRDSDNLRGLLKVNLPKILCLLEAEVRGCSWRIADVDAVGRGAHKLHEAADNGQLLSPDAFASLISEIDQVIDGDFLCYHAGGTRPWLVISAVDSSAFDVESESPAVLEKVRTAFQDVEDLPRDGVM